jgi:hypothetical protein
MVRWDVFYPLWRVCHRLGVKPFKAGVYLPQSNKSHGDFSRFRRYKRYIGFDGLAGACPARRYFQARVEK